MTTKELSVPKKELAQYKTQIETVRNAASEYSITSADDLKKGADLLHEVKRIKKGLEESKKAITAPLMKSLGSVRDLFRPLENAYADAEKVIKDKLLAFQEAEEERIKKEKDRIDKRVEKGTMRVDTAVSKIGELGEAPKTATGAVGSIQTRTIRKLDIIDEAMLPREYLMPDREKITKALFEGVEVPGARLREEKTIASR